jgi:hypothetical protein
MTGIMWVYCDLKMYKKVCQLLRIDKKILKIWQEIYCDVRVKRTKNSLYYTTRDFLFYRGHL